MKIVFATAECAPFVKSGGLADVAAGLPAALAQLGHSVRVYCPYYTKAAHFLDRAWDTHRFATISVLDTTYHIGIYHHATEAGVDIYFLRYDEFFGRDGIYDAHGHAYSDNAFRFALFQNALLEALTVDDFIPDILHANDWHTGLLPAFKDARAEHDSRWKSTRTVFTIHNLQYQGCFPRESFNTLGLSEKYNSSEWCEHFGDINFMKCALAQSDALTTVSPTYAREIQTPVYGCGFDGLLRKRSDVLTGIINGCDPTVWSPAHDPFIPAQYSVKDMSGKAVCKAELQKECGLPVEPDTPLFGLVARFSYQKGIDLVTAVLDGLCAAGAHCIALGKGEPALENALHSAATYHPRNIAVYTMFDEKKAHMIEAGADIFLMPSRFEPCGLNQMYSQLYGTLPIVHKTGGLADTVVDTQPHSVANGTATGFVMTAPDTDSLYSTSMRAISLYKNDRSTWNRIRHTAMRRDFSWSASAKRYAEIYQSL